MTWTRLSDDFADSPAILSVSLGARWLHIEALIWCNRHVTDGAIPTGALRKVTASGNADAEVAELVAAAIWSATPTGWAADWSDQEPGERVTARKQRNAKSQAAFRDRVARCRDGDHSKCGDSKYCRSRRAAVRAHARDTDDVSDDVSDDQSSTRPNSRPDPKGGAGELGERDARPKPGSASAPPALPRVPRASKSMKPDKSGVIVLDVTLPLTELPRTGSA